MGRLVGGAVVNVFLGRQVDWITLLNNSLKDELASREDELKQLQKSLATSRVQKITAVDVYVTISNGKDIPELDQTKARLTMETMVRDWLQPLLGQEIDRLDHQLVSQRWWMAARLMSTAAVMFYGLTWWLWRPRQKFT